MDISRIKKPFHIVCPHCKTEVELWANDIERRYEKAKKEVAEILEQITLFKSEYREDYKNNDWFKRAKRAYAHKCEEVAKLKQTKKMLAKESEKQFERAFYEVVKRTVDRDTFMKYVKEAEEDIQYSTYDMAVQKYSTIMSAPNNNK